MRAAAPKRYLHGGKARHMGTGQYCISGRPEASGVARRIVAKSLGRSHPLLPQAELIVSELVTNAVRHTRSGLADGQVGVTVEQDGHGRVRIEVIDNGPKPGGPSMPTVLPCELLREHGYGLLLVADAAQEWGVIHHPNGYCSVWAVLHPQEETEKGATHAA